MDDAAITSRRHLQVDPVTLTSIMVLWCFVSAASFFMSQDILSSRLWGGIAKLGLSAGEFGGILLVDAILLAITLLPRVSTLTRSLIAFFSACLWLFIGCQTIMSGIQNGFYPRSGIWDLICGAACGLVTQEWPFHEGTR